MSLKDVFAKKIKTKDKPPGMGELARLELRRCTVIYKRLSTYEQLKSSRYSVERLDLLEQIAIRDGYKPALAEEEIRKIKDDDDYPGYYQNGQIVVIDADFGHSGTKGQEARPGLAMLIDLIERDLVESIYTIDVSRLFRDNKLISAPAFATLCKEHGVIIITEG